MSVDRILSKIGKVGKFSGVVEIRFQGNGGTISGYSVSDIKAKLFNALSQQGLTVASLTVTNADYLNSISFQYKLGVLSNEDTISNNSRLVDSALRNVFSQVNNIFVGKFPYNSSLTESDFPHYNPQTYNPTTNTINQNSTNLLISNNYYVVQSGDTLSKIATKFNTTVARLAELNGVQNVNKIYVGQSIKIAGSSQVINNPTNAANPVGSINGSVVDNSSGSVTDTLNKLLADITDATKGASSGLGLGLGLSTPIVIGVGVGLVALLIILKK